jgi:hypothetical protein
MGDKKVQFLKDIYSKQCENGDYIILSAKGLDTPWKDVAIPYNDKTIDKKLDGFFKQYPTEDYDLYWSPMPYAGPKRRLDNSIESKFLVQDIDEYDNPMSIEPKPSYLWESSPGKYQGIWELDRYIPESEYTPLNKALAESIGCDDCFDYCHVYRIPGSINHKYKNNPKVKSPQHTNMIYKPKNLKKLLGVNHKQEEPTGDIDSNDLTERGIYAKYNIPQKVRDLLALTDITGIDRSDTIWYIENKLHELKMTPNEIIYLVKNSSFNKYKGRHDEDKRLRNELDKIISGKIEGKIQKMEESQLRVDSYFDVMGNQRSFPGWLIEGFWGRRSHGIVAGQPKVFKSTFTQDLIISVASGRPFLGKYKVLEPGPVILVQNENADWILKDRTEKLINHRGLVGKAKIRNSHILNVDFPPELPIHFINQQGFSFDNDSHRKQLEDMIVETKPVLIVFDPLYLMINGDLNSASELGPTLQWLLHLKNTYNTGVMVIHHYNKGGNATQVRGGQKMLGSAILHGWVESAWYLKRSDDDLEEPDEDIEDFDKQSDVPSKVIMDREFRLAGTFPQIQLEIAMGKHGDPYYHVDVTMPDKEDRPSNKGSQIEKDIINLIESQSVPVTKEDLRERLGLKHKQINVALDKLIQDKKISPTKNGFTLYK